MHDITDNNIHEEGIGAIAEAIMRTFECKGLNFVGLQCVGFE
jgi:hypothetical protein